MIIIDMRNRFLTLGLIAMSVLCSCSKNEVRDTSCGLNNTIWVPVWAKGEIAASGYTISWDGELDAEGGLTSTYVKNGETVEFTVSFRGYRFYRDGGTDRYVTFYPGRNYESSVSGLYYVEEGKLYIERISGGYSYGFSTPPELEPTGIYDPYVLDELSHDRLSFGGVTYRRVQ